MRFIIKLGYNTYCHWLKEKERAQRLAPARSRTRVVRLGAQCTDHWTTGQNRGMSVPAVQLTTHVKSSTLYGLRSYGRTSKFFRLDGLLQFCIIMGLRSASSALKGKFLVLSISTFDITSMYFYIYCQLYPIL